MSSTSGLIDCYGTIQKYTVYQNYLTILPSDGSVLAESAKCPILVDTSLPGITQTFMKLTETNHIQIENSSKTKSALLALYKGELGPFFATEKR